MGVEAGWEDCYIIPADEIQGKKEEILGMRAAVATSLKNLKATERKQSHARGNWGMDLYGEEEMEGFKEDEAQPEETEEEEEMEGLKEDEAQTEETEEEEEMDGFKEEDRAESW